MTEFFRNTEQTDQWAQGLRGDCEGCLIYICMKEEHIVLVLSLSNVKGLCLFICSEAIDSLYVNIQNISFAHPSDPYTTIL